MIPQTARPPRSEHYIRPRGSIGCVSPDCQGGTYTLRRTKPNREVRSARASRTTSPLRPLEGPQFPVRPVGMAMYHGQRVRSTSLTRADGAKSGFHVKGFCHRGHGCPSHSKPEAQDDGAAFGATTRERATLDSQREYLCLGWNA